ncbi:phenylacetate--CoA ligase family protein [Cylindrospermum sp. FACHB-282]|uniref:phenylacetate--CoA ligase family protein n=1 Tax=Cylindrospermum sp. FACHB-282 TaxID=2692794 RepID=UPI0016882947|nr:phenylacetate--CoA ligase family protein [Cylindrospermum sp. FACHB-282]MBD2387487.1 phenylacetate--CoA ligase family protein [Cylindrospermum sp. FACHB-282]
MITTNARKALFWGLDYLRGAPIYNHLRNIQQVTADKSLLAEHQAQQIQSLLTHAVQTTDYYKNYDKSARLQDFPVVNKNIIRDSFERFESTVFKGKKLKIMETSGSTGTPFRVVQNPSKRQRVLAELICFNSLIGYSVGTRHALFRTIGTTFPKTPFERFKQNEVEFDVRTQNFASFEQQRLTLLKDRHIEILIGYSSVMYDLARHVISQGDTPKSFGVKGVLCLAEPLYPNMRDTIRKAFDCRVLSRYSNQECGVLASECPTSGRFHLNSASYFFETLALDGRDEPTPPGTPGRIVVTDLYNYALPMIRYDTGDIGSIVPNGCPQFATPTLESLEGRRLDMVYDTGGQRLVSFVFDDMFEVLGRLGIVKQFQFIQKSRTCYNLRLCVNGTFTQEQFIVEQCKAILGADAQIEIDYVDEIPVLNSGKRKYIVSLYDPSNEVLSSSNA